MKYSLIALVFFLSFPVCASSFQHELWDDLLKAYVEDGRVRYAGFQAHLPDLDRYLVQIAQYPISSFANDSREDRMALWINTYNAAVIRQILAHYPVPSVDKIPDFWTAKTVYIAGMNYSLRDVRDKVFRQGFRDERVLIALVSGRQDSGPLRAEAYVGSKLLEQLKDQTRLFLSDERFNRIRPHQKKLWLSPIFRHNGADFILGYGTAQPDSQFSAQELAVLSFIKIHSEEPTIKEWIDSRRYKLRYLADNAALNEAVAKEAST